MVDDKTDDEKIQEFNDRYLAAMHAVQSGIMSEIGIRGELDAGSTPKQLRLGINSAMVSQDALIHILIEKGVFTNLDLARAMALAAEREVARYQELLSKETGATVKLV